MTSHNSPQRCSYFVAANQEQDLSGRKSVCRGARTIVFAHDHQIFGRKDRRAILEELCLLFRNALLGIGIVSERVRTLTPASTNCLRICFRCVKANWNGHMHHPSDCRRGIGHEALRRIVHRQAFSVGRGSLVFAVAVGLLLPAAFCRPGRLCLGQIQRPDHPTRSTVGCPHNLAGRPRAWPNTRATWITDLPSTSLSLPRCRTAPELPSSAICLCHGSNRFCRASAPACVVQTAPFVRGRNVC